MKRLRVLRSILGALASDKQDRAERKISPAGLVHEFGVYLIELEIVMARGNGRRVVESTYQAPRFVDIRLTAEQKAVFVKTALSDQAVVDAIQGLVADGYRLGLSWASEQHAYYASLTGRSTGTVNDGFVLTSFAADIRTAVRLTLYKHFEVTEGLWGGNEAADREAWG